MSMDDIDDPGTVYILEDGTRVPEAELTPDIAFQAAQQLEAIMADRSLRLKAARATEADAKARLTYQRGVVEKEEKKLTYYANQLVNYRSVVDTYPEDIQKANADIQAAEEAAREAETNANAASVAGQSQESLDNKEILHRQLGIKSKAERKRDEDIQTLEVSKASLPDMEYQHMEQENLVEYLRRSLADSTADLAKAASDTQERLQAVGAAASKLAVLDSKIQQLAETEYCQHLVRYGHMWGIPPNYPTPQMPAIDGDGETITAPEPALPVHRLGYMLSFLRAPDLTKERINEFLEMMLQERWAQGYRLYTQTGDASILTQLFPPRPDRYPDPQN